jgi:hypothetical protein
MPNNTSYRKNLIEGVNMSQLLLTTAVRTMFILTSRKKMIRQTTDIVDKYLRLAKGLSSEAGRHSIEVPPMRGVDEDMRRWSYFMILEHNSIVNSSISEIVQALALGRSLEGLGLKDPKKDVMPAASAGEEELQIFKDSAQNHLAALTNLPELRGTKTKTHPLFGDFDAHKWNCMFAFHMTIHYKQAEFVAHSVKEGQE